MDEYCWWWCRISSINSNIVQKHTPNCFSPANVPIQQADRQTLRFLPCAVNQHSHGKWPSFGASTIWKWWMFRCYCSFARSVYNKFSEFFLVQSIDCSSELSRSNHFPKLKFEGASITKKKHTIPTESYPTAKQPRIRSCLHDFWWVFDGQRVLER